MIIRDHLKTINSRFSFGMRQALIFGFLALSLFTFSCKSKKTVADANPTATTETMKSRAIRDLKRLLDSDDMTLVQMEREVARIKALHIEDPEVEALLAQAEAKIADERARIEAENNVQVTETGLSGYLNNIAGAGSMNAANNDISDALRLFESPDALVLIVISEEGGEKDYDRPTTIKQYLEYVKDKKQNNNVISGVVKNAQGLITELELTKK